MIRKELKAAAKSQIKGKIGLLLLVYIIVFAIAFVCGIIPVIGGIISAVITPALSIGIIMLYLSLYNNEEISVGDLFKGFNITGKALWLNIITTFFTFLWSLLFIIPGIVKAYSYSMASYILAENQTMTAREALGESKKIMNGHKMDLFILQLSFIPWELLTAITFGIAGIYVIPYMQATLTNFYKAIKQ